MLLLPAILAPNASGAVTYLRPNVDVSLGSWSTTGATTAWDALNDGVTEAETPSSTDYIGTSTASTKAKVGLSSTSLAGNKFVSATAYFYTANSNPVSFKASTNETWSNFSSTGWHSTPVTLKGTQSQLDNLVLEFNSGSGTTSRNVRAAFLKLDRELSAPKIYWGAWMDGDVKLLDEPPQEPGGDAPWDSETWADFEGDAGKPVSIVHFGQPPPWKQKFAPGPLEYTIASGAIPLMDMGTSGATLGELASNSMIMTVPQQEFATWAEAVHGFEHPFFLRLDWEMNLDSSSQFPWVSEAKKSPDTFKLVWRRLHDIAEEKGASNITWVWCPNVSYPGSTSIKSLFPGAQYVDWTCMDGYNSETGEGALTFSELFGATYNELLALTDPNATLPIMIGETATVESGATGKAKWIAEALGTELTKSFPHIKALVWFNWNVEDEAPKPRRQWPIETSLASQESFANAISSPLFAADTFGSLPPLESIQPLP
jgi:hypothetical protein